MRRRDLLKAAAALLALPGAALAQAKRVPIADMHSHYGIIGRPARSNLGDEMRANGVALLAWKLVADGRWIGRGASGISQTSEPAPGELARYFDEWLARMKQALEAQKLKVVLTRADVDSSLAGEPGVVLASEGADFLEGRVESLDSAYERGLRHLQLVHYLRTPVGDFQTAAPTHNGLSDMGRRLVQACNERGILVDLAHCAPPAVEHALEAAKRPTIWSHGWVDSQGGHWQDRNGFLRRRLSLAQARKIAAAGGVIGLWGYGLAQGSLAWSPTRGSQSGYAFELKQLVDRLGADHVALGTDIEGVGPDWSVNDYGHVRKVIEHLQELKLPDSVVERVAYANYARVLKESLKS